MVEDRSLEGEQRASCAQCTHLFVLHHGLWGEAANLAYLEELLTETGKQISDVPLVIVNCRANERRSTYDGIHQCGERVIQVIHDECNKQQEQGTPVTKISFIGYSLGGLILRYVVGRLLVQGFFEEIEPVNFCTIATPHLGAWQFPTNMLKRFFNAMVPIVSSLTGRQLMLLDEHALGSPLLLNMSDPELCFHRALARFPRLLLMANIAMDRMVPYCTAAISMENPYISRDAKPLDPNFPHIVHPVDPGPNGPTPRPWPKVRVNWYQTAALALLPVVIPAVAVPMVAYMTWTGRAHTVQLEKSTMGRGPDVSWIEQSVALEPLAVLGGAAEVVPEPEGRSSSGSRSSSAGRSTRRSEEHGSETALEKQAGTAADSSGDDAHHHQRHDRHHHLGWHHHHHHHRHEGSSGWLQDASLEQQDDLPCSNSSTAARHGSKLWHRPKHAQHGCHIAVHCEAGMPSDAEKEHLAAKPDKDAQSAGATDTTTADGADGGDAGHASADNMSRDKDNEGNGEGGSRTEGGQGGSSSNARWAAQWEWLGSSVSSSKQLLSSWMNTMSPAGADDKLPASHKRLATGSTKLTAEAAKAVAAGPAPGPATADADQMAASASRIVTEGLQGQMAAATHEKAAADARGPPDPLLEGSNKQPAHAAKAAAAADGGDDVHYDGQSALVSVASAMLDTAEEVAEQVAEAVAGEDDDTTSAVLLEEGTGANKEEQGDAQMVLNEGIAELPAVHRLQELLAAALNQLPWKKIDVDTGEFSSHAAIVLRVPSKFMANRDTLDYLMMQLQF